MNVWNGTAAVPYREHARQLVGNALCGVPLVGLRNRFNYWAFGFSIR